jgi:hypothetical protein
MLGGMTATSAIVTYLQHSPSLPQTRQIITISIRINIVFIDNTNSNSNSITDFDGNDNIINPGMYCIIRNGNAIGVQIQCNIISKHTDTGTPGTRVPGTGKS